MGNRGGFRPGSGRKTKADKYSGPIAAAEDRIADRLPELIDNLFELATGVMVQEAMPQGGVKTYARPPCRQSNEYLLNRIMGKPPERLEHDFSGLSDAELIARVQGHVRGDGEAGTDGPEGGD